MPQSPTAEVRRLAALLEAVLRYRGGAETGLRVGARAIERKLGWSAGTLSRVIGGKIELKIRHVLDVLEVLGIPPHDFFVLAYRLSPSDEARGRMYLVESRGSRGLEVGSPTEAATAVFDAELDRRILDALRRISLKAKPAARPRPDPPRRPGQAGADDTDPPGSDD